MIFPAIPNRIVKSNHNTLCATICLENAMILVNAGILLTVNIIHSVGCISVSTEKRKPISIESSCRAMIPVYLIKCLIYAQMHLWAEVLTKIYFVCCTRHKTVPYTAISEQHMNSRVHAEVVSEPFGSTITPRLILRVELLTNLSIVQGTKGFAYNYRGLTAAQVDRE